MTTYARFFVRRSRGLRGLGALLLIAVAVTTMSTTVVTGLPGHESTAQAESPSGMSSDADFTLSVSSPVQNVTDGQALQFTVTRTAAGTAAGVEIKAAITGWCQPSAALPVTESAQVAGNLNSLFGTGVFPFVQAPQDPRGAYACLGNVNNEFPPQQTAISPAVNTAPNVDGEPGDYPTVSGTALAETGSTTFSTPSEIAAGPPVQGTPFKCDSTDPCTFAVAVYASDASDPRTATLTHVLGVPVTYLPDSLNSSCGGSAPGQVASIGDDRLSSAVNAWSLGACGAGVGGGKNLTADTSSQQTDATALCSFAAGKSDLAYSSVGYTAAGFDPSTCQAGPEPARPYVAIPIAVNAEVMAHTQTQTIFALQNPVVGPYQDQLRMTVDQMATLLSNGSFLSGAFEGSWGSSFGHALLAENPELTSDIGYFGTTGNLAPPIVVTSGTSGTTLFTTGFLQALAPAGEMMSKPNEFEGIQSQQLGVTSNFGTADPALYYVNTYTGSAAMIKDLNPPTSSWVLTDAASAAAAWGGQAEVALQTSDSVGSATPNYVAPTKASMWAAVSDMTEQPDGTMVPNPKATPSGGVEPYPLTFVEYAIAPTQPLLNPDCSPNTQGQQTLAAWLNYVTGAGQSELPTGLQPLPPALLGQAAAAIAKVGQAAPACTPTATTPLATNQAPTTSSSSSGSFGGGSSSGSFGSGGNSIGLASFGAGTALGGSGNGTATSSSPNKKSAHQPAVELSRFTAHSGATWIGPLIGLLALAIVLPAFVLAVSGTSLREAMAGLGGARRRRGLRPPGPG
jgi:uncharacterized membrane protein YgcG